MTVFKRRWEMVERRRLRAHIYRRPDGLTASLCGRVLTDLPRREATESDPKCTLCQYALEAS